MALSPSDHRPHETLAALRKEKRLAEEEEGNLKRWRGINTVFHWKHVDNNLQRCIPMLLPASTGLAERAKA